MRRRSFLAAGTALGAASLGVTRIPRTFAATDRIGQLVFDSTASLLNSEQQPLTDDSLVAVWAEKTAFNVDEDGDGNAVNYPDSVRIPLVVSDSGTVGFGAPIVQDDTRFSRDGNEEFVLNILDSEIGGGTILFDEGHGQFYDTSKFDAFIGYAETNGYTIEATTDIAAELDSAQGAIITSPSEAFTDAQLNELGEFVVAGGSLLLFSQSDFGDYDATANLNAIAAAIDANFRFNDDQVLDPERNVGPNYIPVTDEFNTAFEYFDERPGLGLELDPTKTYTVDVVEVTDGDTIDVRFANGIEDTVRMLGIDSPETASQFERPQEWEGIESLDYLREEGFIAENYAFDRLAGKTVEISFDPNEPLREGFGRLLAYVSVDGTLYNQRIIADGHARVYDSGLTRHDAFLETERASRADERGVWKRSNPNESTTIRNDAVDALFFPRATSITAKDQPLDDIRVPVYAAPTARQIGGDVYYKEDIPLVGIDRLAGVAMVGGPLVDESYEQAEGYPIDTSDFGNFAFLTNLLDRVAFLSSLLDCLGIENATSEELDSLMNRQGNLTPDKSSDNVTDDGSGAGLVLIDGGHGQFGAEYALSAEDAAYYLRYLEGVDIGFEGVNDIAVGFGKDLLSEAQVFIVTTPTEPFTDAELDALGGFVADGGGVILMGSAAPLDARAHLNEVASALDSDLRLNTGRVVDPKNNLDEDPTVPVTSNFNDLFRLSRLFSGYTGDLTFTCSIDRQMETVWR